MRNPQDSRQAFYRFNTRFATRIPGSVKSPCNLGNVKLPWQKSENASDSALPADAAAGDATDAGAEDTVVERVPKGYTPPKAKPTPKRRDREIERGVIRDPNAATAAQAGQRRKELKKSMSKEEWKAYKRKERAESAERNRLERERIDSGDPRYLMARDQGEERTYVRDWVDSKRFFSNFFMPLALVMLLTLFVSTFSPELSNILMIIAWAAIALFLVEGITIGYRVNKATRAKFPGTEKTGFGLGFYAFSRVTQPRKWRTPRARVKLGDTV